MKIILSASLIASALLLSGCGGVPSCSDSDAKDLVIDIATKQFENKLDKETLSKIEIALESIRTRNTNEKSGAHECAADITFSFDVKKGKSPITYTIEPTDDGNFYINVFGL